MRIKLKTALVVALLGMGAVVFLLFGSGAQKADPVSLVFQRYSDLDPYVGDVAFLWLTNASSNSYSLTMAGGNTTIVDTSFGQFRQSARVNCEFSEETPRGWSNWVETPSPFKSSNAYLSLGPRSGITIRVPLPADGLRRRVAVLYEGPYDAPSSFWFTPTGYRVLRMMPQPLRKKLLISASSHKVWCDRELLYPSGSLRRE